MAKLLSPLKELRLRLKLNQRDFSRLISKSQSFLSDLEAGAVDLPEDSLEKLQELGVDVQALQNEHEVFMQKRLELLKRSVIDKLKREK